MSDGSGTQASGRSRRIVLITATILFAAAMLRAPLVAVAPVAGLAADELGIGLSVVGLLTSIPVLCFALCAPIAIAVVRRGGTSFALTVALVGAIVGCLLRSAGGLPLALVGTAVLGLFLTIGNIVVPLLISREYPPHRAHLMTGIYTAAINVGTMTVTVATAPLAAAGLGWRGAILLWAVFGAVAIGTWIAARGLRTAFDPSTTSITQPDDPAAGSVLASSGTWILAAAFAGQAFSYYGTTAWLPTLLEDNGYAVTAAGAISAIFQVAGIAGALLVSFIMTRFSVLAGVVFVGVAWLVLPIGFLIDPGLWAIWCVVAGLGQAGGLTVVFIMIAGYGGGERRVASRSGIVQGVGYGIAALGPIVIGGIHDATGGWTLPLLALLCSVLLFGIAGTVTALRQRAAAAGSGAPADAVDAS